MTKRVVITDFDYPDDGIERHIVESAGFELESFHALEQEEIAAVAAGASSLLVQYGKVGSAVIDAVPTLEHIARYGVGVDIVDVDYATRQSIQVTNVPADYCLNEVADHAVAMLLAINRQLFSYDLAVRSGAWRWQDGAPIRRLGDCTVGIIGLGRIGQAIARRVSGFGSAIIAHDPFCPDRTFKHLGVSSVSRDQLLSQSDYVILQTPLTPDTVGMIGADELALMKSGAALINTARGPLVDTEALDAAIRSGHIRGAGLDDLPEEPAKQIDWIPRDRLLENADTVITPHAAYYSEQSLAFCRAFAAEEAVRFLRGETVRSPVNQIEKRREGVT